MAAFENLLLSGGCAAFDFVNTFRSRDEQGKSFDHLTDFPHVLSWSRKAGIVSKNEMKVLDAFSELHPEKVEESFRKALGARQILHQLFTDIARQQNPDRQKQERFNVLLSECFSRIQVSIKDNQVESDFSTSVLSLDLPLWRVVKSAYDILSNEDFRRIRRCPGCHSIFLDRTRNNKRRWCHMSACGSRDKALRYYHRNRTREDNANRAT